MSTGGNNWQVWRQEGKIRQLGLGGYGLGGTFRMAQKKLNHVDGVGWSWMKLEGDYIENI